jgi:hypothetical protein
VEVKRKLKGGRMGKDRYKVEAEGVQKEAPCGSYSCHLTVRSLPRKP